MDDIVDKLVADVEATVIKTCAATAEIHSLRIIDCDFDRGYIAACRDIAAEIRKLNKGKV